MTKVKCPYCKMTSELEDECEEFEYDSGEDKLCFLCPWCGAWVCGKWDKVVIDEEVEHHG